MKKIFLRLNLSYFCEANCSHCFIPLKYRRDERRLSIQEIESALAEFGELLGYIESLGEFEVHLVVFGGEVLSLPEGYLFDVLDALSSNTDYNFKLVFNTALLLSRPDVLRRLASFENYDLVSSYDNEGRFRGEADFASFVENLAEAEAVLGKEMILVYTITRNTGSRLSKAFLEIDTILKRLDSPPKFVLNRFEENTTTTAQQKLTPEDESELFSRVEFFLKSRGVEVEVENAKSSQDLEVLLEMEVILFPELKYVIDTTVWNNSDSNKVLYLSPGEMCLNKKTIKKLFLKALNAKP